jgi:pimeloyl-ACP methyl ester carboxylesterase
VAQGVLGAAPLIRRVLDGSVARPEAMPPRLVARYLAPFAGADGVAQLLTLARALRKEDVEELVLTSIAAPTLIVWGEKEPWLDAGLPERLRRAIPGSNLVHLSGVGALVPEEAPTALADLLLEHMSREAAHERSADARFHQREGSNDGRN